MAKKDRSARTKDKKGHLDPRARQARTTRIVIIVISVILILSWVLSLLRL